MNFKNNILWPAVPLAVACLTVGFTLFSCADKDIETDDSNGKALVAFNVSETQDQALAGAKTYGPISRAAFTRELALQDLTPEDLTMQKLPVQGAAGAGLCLIETTVAGVPSQLKAEVSTRANITTMATLQHFSTTAFYGSSDASLAPWFRDKETKEDGTLVSPMYWDWIKNHACFYAVYPRPYSKLVLSPESHTGTPYVDFTVESDVKNQKDLMTACSGNVHSTIGTMSATAPRTDLTFRHALTAVRFKVGQNLSYSKYITKVEIIGAKSKGKYILPIDKTLTGTWEPTSLSTPTTFTLGGDGTVNVSTSEAVNNVIMGNTGDNFTFYMIPQSLAGVQVKVYFSDGSTPITANLAGTWKPGTTKTYALSQNTSTWEYQLTITPPSTVPYYATKTNDFYIQSYREDPISHTKQKVAWNVVGYDTNNDGVFSMTEPLPSWFKGMSKTHSEGSTLSIGEACDATLLAGELLSYTDLIATMKLYPKGSPSGYYDLSLHDVKGNITARNTANCYVISHPGFYRIPLVYGNAIKNGLTNSNAYQTSVTGAYVLQHFKDHNDQDITDPWIEKTNSGANNGIDDAKIVWADGANLVHFGSNKIVRSGDETFLQFEVKAEDIQNSNAVVAVTKGGTVVWSWHLWFAPERVLNTIACTNREGYVYKITESPLGAKFLDWDNGTSYSTPRSLKVKIAQERGQGAPMMPKEGIITITQNPKIPFGRAYTPYYQFGRKDALPNPQIFLVGNSTYDNTGGRSLGYAIQHPENIFNRRGILNDGDWCNVSYYNLWSANNNVSGPNDNPVVKTIYDPCPAGFKMPAGNAFTGFGNTGTWQGGSAYSTWLTQPNAIIFFPASGFRAEQGVLYRFGTNGDYWLATPSGTESGGAMYFTQYSMYPHDNESRFMGLTVRPIADEDSKSQHQDTDAGGSLGN